MCGVAGIVSNNDALLVQKQLAQMLQVTRSRGPDSQGTWQHENLFLGHNRLAIHDLSADGHQPMRSDCGGHCIIFNGEIYNYRTLRNEIAPEYKCRGASDTEVLLACLSLWGVEKTLQKIDGMFVFAYWEESKNQLTIARDRMGEKPLYFRQNEQELLFSSELKGIVAGTLLPLSIDPHAVNLFLQYSYIPAPYSIYQGVEKLLPGHYLTVDLSCQPIKLSMKAYYNFSEPVESQFNDNKPINLESLLINSIEQRLDADVPVGAFLSGGIDSSLVCAIAKKELNTEISAHTIGFQEPEFDESLYAKEVAEHLGFEHHIHMLTQNEMLDIVPKMVSTYDEPFADASQLPTYLLCQKTREMVTVALSGDGGDELFGGYSRYHIALNRWKKVAGLPLALRSSIRRISDATSFSLESLDYGVKHKEKLRRGLRYWGARDLSEFYRDTVSYDWSTQIADKDVPADNVANSNNLRYLMQVDALRYMPDCILTKVDRASMAHSLEVRVPLLANDILHFSKGLTASQLVNSGRGKWPLRELLYKYVPEAVIERPKRGFAVPLKHWLRDQLKSWAEVLLSNNTLQERVPFVPHKKYHKYWLQHQSKRFDWSGQLWNYLQLLNWLENQMRKN